MATKLIESNQVTLVGEIVSDYIYSHTVHGEKFYIVNIRIERTSGVADIIPVMISDRLFYIVNSFKGRVVSVEGQLRSFNKHDETGSKLILTVFAREMEFVNEADNIDKTGRGNKIILDGYICKEPVYRKTPLEREIVDILIAVNRPYGKSDYIPCIAWGRTARYISKFEVGQRCLISGRIQSREYIKKISRDTEEKRIAYEVSISKLELPEE